MHIQLIFWHGHKRTHNGERIVSLVVLGKLDIHMQRNETGPLSYIIHKEIKKKT